MARKYSKKTSSVGKSRKSSRKGSRRSSKKSSRKSRLIHRILSREAGEKGNLKYLHKYSHTTVIDGVATVVEEFLISGDTGITVKHYKKNEKGEKSKLVAKQNADGTFRIKTVHGDKIDEKTLSKEDTLKMLAKDKDLKFASDYLKQSGGKRRASRKSKKSKKSSKARK